MSNNELLDVLMKENESLMAIRQELVELRTKETHIEGFTIQDVYTYSQYFNISMHEFLNSVLNVDKEDYTKFIKGKIKKIKSILYSKLKEKYLRRKRQIFLNKINLNVRTYFNKDEIEKCANNLNINKMDFCLKILDKSKSCARRVIDAKDLQTRLYTGKYVNAKLPEGYLEKNIKQITRTTKMAIINAIRRHGMKLNKFDFEDEVQKGLIYLNDNGNNLYKNNTLQIRNLKLREKRSKVFYLKVFYYELNELNKIKFNSIYNDNLGYKTKMQEDEPDNILDELNLNKLERIVAEDILDGHTIEEIAVKENIEFDKYIEIKESIGRKLMENRKKKDEDE